MGGEHRPRLRRPLCRQASGRLCSDWRQRPAIRILATLLRPDEGRAAVGGLDVVRHAPQVRRLIGLTGQYASVDWEGSYRLAVRT